MFTGVQKGCFGGVPRVHIDPLNAPPEHPKTPLFSPVQTPSEGPQNRPKTGLKQAYLALYGLQRPVLGLKMALSEGVPEGGFGVSRGCIYGYMRVHIDPLNAPPEHPKTPLSDPCADPSKGPQNRPKTGPKRPFWAQIGVLGLFWACFDPLLEGLYKGAEGWFWGVPRGARGHI